MPKSAISSLVGQVAAVGVTVAGDRGCSSGWAATPIGEVAGLVDQSRPARGRTAESPASDSPGRPAGRRPRARMFSMPASRYSSSSDVSCSRVWPMQVRWAIGVMPASALDVDDDVAGAVAGASRRRRR